MPHVTRRTVRSNPAAERASAYLAAAALSLFLAFFFLIVSGSALFVLLLLVAGAFGARYLATLA